MFCFGRIAKLEMSVPCKVLTSVFSSLLCGPISFPLLTAVMGQCDVLQVLLACQKKKK